MNRPIKFRAWVKHEKIMLPVIRWGDDGVICVDIKCLKFKNPRVLLPLDQYELLQFTGLKDKNGVEIFENDIVKASLYESMECHDSCVGKVWWDEYSGWMMIDKPIARYMRDDDDAFSIEVIGNIYEHPHLLEKA